MADGLPESLKVLWRKIRTGRCLVCRRPMRGLAHCDAIDGEPVCLGCMSSLRSAEEPDWAEWVVDETGNEEV